MPRSTEPKLALFVHLNRHFEKNPPSQLVFLLKHNHSTHIRETLLSLCERDGGMQHRRDKKEREEEEEKAKETPSNSQEKR